MFSHKMDLTLKVCLFPFTEYEFYLTDYIEELSKKKDMEEYRKYFYNDFLNKIYVIINRTQQVHNLDEINLLFDMFYPRSKLLKTNCITEFYMGLLSRLTKSFMCHRNGKIALKYWKSDGEEDFIGPYRGLNKIALWNSMNRMFTTDLLVIRYLLDNGMRDEAYLNGYYSSIMLEDLQLEQILKKGVAETHIHKSAGINFYISWIYLMKLSGKKNNEYKEHIFSDPVIRKVNGFTYYVKAIAIIRVIIAYFVENNESQSKIMFSNYIKANYKCGGYSSSNIRDRRIYDLINDIFRGKQIVKDEYNFSQLWDRIIEKLNIQQNKEIVRNIFDEDILNNILPKSRYLRTTTENFFLFKCMKYIDNNLEDEFFNKIFWQYIRIKNEVFQLKVQGNRLKGLINFKNYFDRSTEINGYTSKEYWKIIMLNQFQNTHLKKIELRSGFGIGNSVETIKNSIKKTLKAFFQAYIEIVNENYVIKKDDGTREKNYREAPNIGLVFHMIKAPDRKEFEKCWQNYCGIENSELYFRELQVNYLKQIRALNELREEIEELSEYVLGIDAASIENNTEPWVFAPVYEEARDSKFHKTVYINSNSKSRIKSLGFTFHVGEDFRHLLTGLRRIDEVIEHFKFHAGDRIGHGIALGIDVGKWINNNKIVIVPRGEYLESLLWIWGLYKNGQHSKCVDIGYLEQQILLLAEKIYVHMEGITVYDLWKAYRNKFKTFKVYENYKKIEINNSEDCKINKLFCINVKNYEAIIWNPEKLTHAQHCQCYLERMLEPIQIEIKELDVEMLKQIQKIIATKVSVNGIIVETNPSSNIAIGEIDNIFEHYIYTLNQRGLNTEINPENAVMISINSDDPSVFNTNVSNEFAYIFYALQEKGYSREDALLWIDKVRNYGMESSFIDNRGLDTKQRLNEIKAILEELNR